MRKGWSLLSVVRVFCMIFPFLIFGSCSIIQNKDLVLDGLKPIHTFDSGRLVHPKMVWELMPWISDDEEQMLVLSVSDTERSNRYFEPVEKLIFDDGREFVHYTCRLGKHLRFGYIYHGRSDSGIHVLETIESSRGSGTFVSRFLCRLEDRKK